jgi:hypothetical protein
MGGAAVAASLLARLGVDWGGTTADGAVTVDAGLLPGPLRRGARPRWWTASPWADWTPSAWPPRWSAP